MLIYTKTLKKKRTTSCSSKHRERERERETQRDREREGERELLNCCTELRFNHWIRTCEACLFLSTRKQTKMGTPLFDVTLPTVLFMCTYQGISESENGPP